MSRETIKDSKFQILGHIDTASDGKQTARDDHFRILGYYDPKTNQTKDHQFRILGYGNLLASLIR